MPPLPVTILITMLGLMVMVGLVVLMVMSLRQGRRRARLAKMAGELGFRYSREDPFDIPGRCAEFALVTAGHSPVAANMISGHLEGMAVRAFDFQYEVGHSARRMMRRYAVILLETESPLPRLLMWHSGDFPPIPARQTTHVRGPWSIIGDGKRGDGQFTTHVLATDVPATNVLATDVLAADVFATDVLAACTPWFAHGGCVETAGHAILLATPYQPGRSGFPHPLPDIVKTVKRLLITQELIT